MDTMLRVTSDVILAGQNLALMANRGGHEVHAVDRSVAEALRSREAWTPDALAAAASSTGISLDWLLARGIVQPFAVTSPPHRPLFIALVTADRPAACARALSFLMAQQNTERHGHLPILVIDNSSTTEGRDGTERAVITAVRRLRGRAIIADRQVAERLVEAISAIDVEAGEAARFALLRRDDRVTSVGSARNLLTLLTRGCAVLSIDDDVTGPVLHPRPTDAGFTLGGESIGVEPRSNVDLRDWRECNLVDAHRQSLGGFLAPKLTEQIVLTTSGLVTRQVFRGTQQPTVTRPVFGLTCFAFGLVNDGPLPPFMPIGGNENDAFAMMVHVTRPTARVGHLAIAVRHAPIDRRNDAHDRDPRRALAQRWRTNDLMIRLAAQTRPQVDPAARLSQLTDAVRTMADAIRRGAVSGLRDQHVAHQIDCGTKLTRWQPSATWWQRRRTARALAQWPSSAWREDDALPVEWASTDGERFGSYLDGCAMMLDRWPRVIAAVDSLPAWQPPWRRRGDSNGVRHVEPR
jgi:hypothetical protein